MSLPPAEQDSFALQSDIATVLCSKSWSRHCLSRKIGCGPNLSGHLPLINDSGSASWRPLLDRHSRADSRDPATRFSPVRLVDASCWHGRNPCEIAPVDLAENPLGVRGHG